MGSQVPHHQLHFVLFPFMAQGHMIPMMDIAKILVQHNVVVTVVTTPKNAARFAPIFAHHNKSGVDIRLVELQFPFEEAGLQDGCENLDMLHSLGTSFNLFMAANLLRKPVEKLFQELTPPPSCIISDMSLPYTIHIANKFNIPRISFVGMSCFTLLCFSYLRMHNVKERISNESEYFVVPGIPDKIEITIAQTEGLPKDERWKEFHAEIGAAEMDSYGMIMNSFEELEPAYARDYKKLKKDKLWCIGPLSLSNNDYLEKAQRGCKKASIDEWQHQKWLDSQKPESVIYACFGSLCNFTPSQLIMLALALEASKRPFIWVIRESSQLEALEKLIKEDGYEERIHGKGLIDKTHLITVNGTIRF
ncbi:hypothetical protein RIF29_39880 [Crotalaria pallida]|uniref:Uncharacterized protein n=1 Tax=Crotalaria pallida TaxID=3830 RepID=A0AAN9E7H5_CROPI